MRVRDLMDLLKRRWTWSIGGFVLTLGALLAAFFLTDPIVLHEASATVIVGQVSESPPAAELDRHVDGPPASSQEWIRRLKNGASREQLFRRLRKRVAGAVGTSEPIRIRMTENGLPNGLTLTALHRDPAVAATLANALAEVLQEQATEWIEKNISSLQRARTELEMEIRSNRKRRDGDLGPPFPDSESRQDQTDVKIAQLQQMQSFEDRRLVDLDRDIAAAMHLRSTDVPTSPNARRYRTIVRNHLETLYAQLAEMSRIWNQDHPFMKWLEERILQTERRLSDGRVEAMLDELALQKEELASRRESRAIELQGLLRTREQAHKHIEETGRDDQEALRPDDEQETPEHRQLELDRYVERAEALKGLGNVRLIKRAAEGSVRRVTDPAWLLWLAALLIPFGAAAGAAWLGDRVDPTVRTAAHVRRHMNISVGGLIPIFPREQLSELAPEVPTALMEEFDRFATLVNTRPNRRRLKTILITSTHRGEGKTTFAIHFAAALARQGKRVTLVDGDLRTPSLHHRLVLVDRPGFTDLLEAAQSEGRIREAKIAPQATDVEGLQAVPVGAFRKQPVRLLQLRRLRLVAQHLREKADFVVIDSPSLMGATDSAKLASVADGIVLVVQSGRINKRDADGPRNFIERLHTPVLWAALNGVPKGKVARASAR